jgi:hypothetical protein
MENNEPNFYNYKALNLLTDNIDEYLTVNVEKITNIKIISYEIKNNSKYPYIKYLLFKNLETNTLNFANLEINELELNSERLILLSKLKLLILLDLNENKNYDEDICFKGFCVNNEELHIFFDLTNCKIEIESTSRKYTIFFCLIDEIINHTNICNFSIEPYVTNFFNSNIDFCFLKNKNDTNYEVPSVGYVGIPQNTINFTYVFGISKNDNNAILGPYYYFTDYNNSIKECEIIIDNNNYAGIVRFALFLGKIKVIENLINDEIDKSDTKKERLLDPNLDSTIEELTIRISDHDGKWTENYDSVYLGQIKLDNDEHFKNTPIIVVKEYYQQVPLSCHYINNNYIN